MSDLGGGGSGHMAFGPGAAQLSDAFRLERMAVKQALDASDHDLVGDANGRTSMSAGNFGP